MLLVAVGRLAVAREEGVRRVWADVLVSNKPMRRVCERAGLRVELNPADHTLLRAEADLG